MAGGGSLGTPSSSNKFLTQDGATDRLQTTLTEETSSGITTGVPVFIQSDAEASKTATVKNFIVTGMNALVDKNNSTAGDNIREVSIIWLTQNRFVATYVVKQSTTYYYYVAAGTITDEGQVAISGTQQVTASSVSNPTRSLCRMTDTKFLLSYSTFSTQNTVQIGSYDSTNLLSLGTGVNTSTSNGTGSVSRLTDSTFILVYITPSSALDATAVVGSVTGTTITLNSTVTIDSTNASWVNVVALSATQAIVTWSISGAIKAQTLNISGGTTVANGASSTTVASIQENGYLVALSSSKFAIAYNDSATTGNVTAKIATVSGDTLTFGSAVTIDSFSANGAGTIGIAAFGSDIVVAYVKDTSGPGYQLTFAHITISGTAGTVASKNLVAYQDGQNQNDAYYPIIAVVNGAVVIPGSSSGDNVTIFVFKPQFNEVYMGVAKSAPVSNVVPIIQKGRTGALYSGLTFGKKYLFNQDGSIAENGVVPGGVAISTTELLIS